MRYCIKCGTLLDDKNWSQSNQKKRVYVCTKCNSDQKKKWVENNRERSRSSCRERMRRWREKNPERNKEMSRLQCEKHREEVNARAREYSKTHREIKNAQLSANYALKKGIINKSPCIVCGAENAEMHHDDYEKPLEIKWLCPTHHMRHHRWVN